MAGLRDRLSADLKDAMRSGETVRRDEIRGLLAVLQSERQSKLARTLVGQANLEGARGGQGSTTRARQRLQQALALFEELGMTDSTSLARRRLCALTHQARDPLAPPLPANLTGREVAVVGTGLVGTSVALAAAAAGMDVRGFDPDPRALERSAEVSGLAPAGSPEEASAGSGVVFVCSPVPAVAETVVGCLRGAPLVTTDVTVEKSFRFSERMKFDLRGEFYNILNHANFNIPGATLGGADFGVVTSARPGRQVQLAGRISF